MQASPSKDPAVDEHKAVIRDISLTGACFLTRVPLDEGDRLNLTIQLARNDDAKVVDAGAKVVRVEVFEPERADVWSCQIAVEFDAPLEGYEEEIDELAGRLEKAGLPW